MTTFPSAEISAMERIFESSTKKVPVVGLNSIAEGRNGRLPSLPFICFTEIKKRAVVVNFLAEREKEKIAFEPEFESPEYPLQASKRAFVLGS